MHFVDLPPPCTKELKVSAVAQSAAGSAASKVLGSNFVHLCYVHFLFEMLSRSRAPQTKIVTKES